LGSLLSNFSNAQVPATFNSIGAASLFPLLSSVSLKELS